MNKNLLIGLIAVGIITFITVLVVIYYHYIKNGSKNGVKTKYYGGNIKDSGYVRGSVEFNTNELCPNAVNRFTYNEIIEEDSFITIDSPYEFKLKYSNGDVSPNWIKNIKTKRKADNAVIRQADVDDVDVVDIDGSVPIAYESDSNPPVLLNIYSSIKEKSYSFNSSIGVSSDFAVVEGNLYRLDDVFITDTPLKLAIKGNTNSAVENLFISYSLKNVVESLTGFNNNEEKSDIILPGIPYFVMLLFHQEIQKDFNFSINVTKLTEDELTKAYHNTSINNFVFHNNEDVGHIQTLFLVKTPPDNKSYYINGNRALYTKEERFDNIFWNDVGVLSISNLIDIGDDIVDISLKPNCI